MEDYLDLLLAATPGPPREVRALLAEAEAHLRDATAEGVAEGLPVAAAEARAVERFGPVRRVAAAEARRREMPLRTLGRRGVASGLLLAAVGGIAVGVSGIIVAILGALGGPTFIVDISRSTPLAASDCARWLSQDPGAHSCYQAALADWHFEVIAGRLLVGIAGLLALAAYALLRRRWSRRDGVVTLPDSVLDTIAALAFSVSGVVLLALGIDWLAIGRNGAGQWLGAAPVALALACYYCHRLVDDLRRDPLAASS